MARSDVMSFGSGVGGGIGLNCIEHHVSKLDTLAGVAIKYGVEVADIKRMNGLVTDLQMFALKTLRIPLPGRHPPSSDLSNGLSHTGENGCKKTPKPIESQAMNDLQKHYSLNSSDIRSNTEETETTVYRSATSDYFYSKWLPRSSPIIDKSPNNYNKSRNLPNGLLDRNYVVPEDMPFEDAIDLEAEKIDEKSVRRRQKADAGFNDGLLERLLKEDSSESSWSSSTGRSLALRPKPMSRALVHAESDAAWLDSIAVGLGDAILTAASSAFHKSPSASSFREQEKHNSAIVWPPTNWSLKADFQALSASSFAKPIFDGITIPIAGCKIKAALD